MERIYNFRAEYTKYIIEPALGESSVGGAMAVYGAFDAICSLAMGRLASGLKSTTLIVCAGAFIQLCVTSGVLGILYPLLIVAALGIGDGIFNTQLNALLGKLFKHDMEGAFAQLKVWQCASIAVVFFVSPHVSLHVVLVVMLVVVCISVVGNHSGKPRIYDGRSSEETAARAGNSCSQYFFAGMGPLERGSPCSSGELCRQAFCSSARVHARA
ncbi:hypothetical protein HYC85_008912 [Camellia sinensis]|uniref:Uncharacterized protein n=1 Tax=Camellia sinensis TaxID=4442 RepID=A0A7J7HVG2_CAMSI|nr:hypothetical protein HYC85_008912 [Camellia sinensis]